jgi:cytochrome c oxidase subunit 1
MMALAGITGIIAIAGGGMYLLNTVWSVFLGKKITTPGFQHVRAKDGIAPSPKPVAAAIAAHHPGIGAAGMVAPGTFVLAMVFLVSFILYYFINWKYLSTVWPLG